MKRKLFVSLAFLLLTVVVLSVAFIPTLADDDEDDADGTWCYTPLGQPILVDVGFTPPGKLHWAGTYRGEWTGTFHGVSQDTALMVAHEIDPGPPPIGAPMLYIGTVSLADVEVDGVSGGLEMDLNMEILGDSPSTASQGRGRWIITSGTGDLEDFRAEGTWWGPGWNPEEPEKCGLIYYSVDDMDDGDDDDDDDD